MHQVKLINSRTEEWTLVEANKVVLAWLWKNYYRLGYDEIEDLTAIQNSGVYKANTGKAI